MSTFELTPEVVRILTVGTFEEKLRLARTMTGEEKVIAGLRLFDIECEKERAKIRAKHPWASEPLVQKFLRDRLDEERNLWSCDFPFIVDVAAQVVIHPPGLL
jgi:hypothetical protein